MMNLPSILEVETKLLADAEFAEYFRRRDEEESN